MGTYRDQFFRDQKAFNENWFKTHPYPNRTGEILKSVVCLPELDDQVAANPAFRELFALMKNKGMVVLSDLLEGKVVQKDRIDIDEIYRLGQSMGMDFQEHGDFPLSPKKVWVRLSDVTKQPLQPTDKRCKLTREQVNEMRRLKTQGMSYRQLAKRFGVRSPSTVSKVIHGRCWKNGADEIISL
jgi:hypothetical protein